MMRTVFIAAMIVTFVIADTSRASEVFGDYTLLPAEQDLFQKSYAKQAETAQGLVSGLEHMQSLMELSQLENGDCSRLADVDGRAKSGVVLPPYN